MGANSGTPIAVGGPCGAATAIATISNTAASTGTGTLTSTGPSLNTEVVTTSSPQAATWILPFILDIYLTQQPAPTTPTTTTTTSNQGEGSIGTTIVSPSWQAPATSKFSESLPIADGTLTAPFSAGAVSAALPTASVAENGLDLSESFNERVPTGPFASRSASPLGPFIAASMSDPTSPVDRHERGLFQDMEWLGVDPEAATPVVLLGDLAYAGAESPPLMEFAPRSSKSEEDDGSIVVLTGRGVFPLKVTSAPTAHHGDLAALLAALPDSTRAVGGTTAASSIDRALNELPVGLDTATSSSTERPEFPDYIKAAFGLAIGLGGIHFTRGNEGNGGKSKSKKRKQLN